MKSEVSGNCLDVEGEPGGVGVGVGVAESVPIPTV